MDDNDKKLKFIEAMTKHGLAHFGLGGLVSGILGTNNDFQAANAPTAAQLNNAQSLVTSGIGQQQDFSNQAAAQNGFGNQSNVFAQQQALANQLQNQANGQGPNPAQAALNQSTGVNIANQGALMAGQRGASANPALIARLAAQQGAATQQQSVGQGATLQAQQQIAAQQALQQQQAQLQSVAANQIGTQGNAVNNLTNSSLQNQGQLQSANQAANTINSGVASGNQAAAGKAVGGLFSGLSSASSLISGAGGAGAEGGLAGAGEGAGGLAPLAMFAAHGGKVEPMSHAAKWLKGDVQPLQKGGVVKASDPSQKAVVNKDSFANDKIPAMMSEGEVVIDKNTLNDKGPMGQMARALAAHMKKKNARQSA